MNIRRLVQVMVFLLAGAGSALAHEKGAIRLSSKRTEVHSTIAVQGERLTKNAAFRLELRGTLATFNLGAVKSDARGTFVGDFTLPPEAGAGNYALVLIATDGDESARADLTLTPVAVAAADEHTGHETMPGMNKGSAAPATKEMMALGARTTGAEWSAIIGFSTLSLAAGLGLLRRRRT
jgi:hypothetical protein